jgi:3-hydroxyisobutyrate dehydrogenase
MPGRPHGAAGREMPTIGWIGLGAMGGPMATLLAQAGYRLAVFDIDPGRTDLVIPHGALAVPEPAAAAMNADVVVLMVATAEQAEDVLFKRGAAAALRPGAVLMVMATVGPRAVEDWARRLGEHDVELVDAPVSGGVARAGTGDLLIMVGGASLAVQRVRPLLDDLARTAPVVGPRPGDGQRVKLVNQLLCGVHIAVAAEALAFAESMTLDARACWEVVREGAAASFMLDDRGERMVDGAFTDPKSRLEIFVKDMGLVIDAARESGYAAPLATVAEQLYLAGFDAGLARLDDSSIIEVMRARAAAAQSNQPADGR